MKNAAIELKPAVTGLALLGAVAFMLASAVQFLHHDALPYVADYGQDTFARYWVNRGWLLVHIAGGTVALLTGPLQLWTGLRRRVPGLHRWLGRAYLVAIALAATSSFYLALHTKPDFGIALFVLALMWWLTIALAYIAIRNRRVDAHREWMIRSYIVTFSFVTFRFIVPLSAFDAVGSGRAATALWISWVAPYMVAEVVMQWHRVGRRRQTPRRETTQDGGQHRPAVSLTPAGTSDSPA